MKVLATGLQGLLGSRISDLLSSSYTFENISRTTGVDITDVTQVRQAIKQSNADVILHLAAKTDDDGCEDDKMLGEKGQAWRVNVEGTKNIAQACEENKKKLVYISTDFVFDGEKEFYTEEDAPHPINWYATTKYEGEKIVQQLTIPWVICRIAYPYRAIFLKNDFVRAVKTRLENQDKVTMVTNHIMTPTFIDDIAYAIKVILQKEAVGIYHIVGSTYLSPFEAAETIAHIFTLNTSLISQTTREAFFQGRAPRPFRLALKNDKIQRLGVKMKTFSQGLEEIKKQL
jgi:dTDP-4-dehydrorhamnose reductase